MKRTLQIHIDANRVTCGKCRMAVRDYADLCSVFGDELRVVGRSDGTYDLLRCAPCLAAEREASDAGV